MKWICILILFLSPFFIWGQKENVLFVSTQRLTTLNLSNIADKSTVISLNINLFGSLGSISIWPGLQTMSINTIFPANIFVHLNVVDIY